MNTQIVMQELAEEIAAFRVVEEKLEEALQQQDYAEDEIDMMILDACFLEKQCLFYIGEMK